jgi:hypothetical protein
MQVVEQDKRRLKQTSYKLGGFRSLGWSRVERILKKVCVIYAHQVAPRTRTLCGLAGAMDADMCVLTGKRGKAALCLPDWMQMGR